LLKGYGRYRKEGQDEMGFILAITVILLLYGGTNFYIGKRIFQGLSYLFPNMDVKLFGAIYTLIAITLILGFLTPHSTFKRIMSWLGSYWMGIFVYLLMLFLLADLIILLGSLLKIFPNPLTPNIRLFESILVLFLTIALVSYGIYNANQLKQVSYQLNMKEKLAQEVKIVLISDLHLGAVNSERKLEKIVEGINSLEPDLVCLAGDIFNDDFNSLRDPERVKNLLKKIKSTYGVYGAPGNHDGGETFKEMENFLEESNIKLLKDEYVVIDEKLVLVGRLDPSPIGGYGGLKRKDTAELLASIDMGTENTIHAISPMDPQKAKDVSNDKYAQDANEKNKPIGSRRPVVVLDHTPANIEQYGQEVDLILAGHTHKGQIFPFNFVTDAIFTVHYGHYQKDAHSPHVIVTSGVGTWSMPMRIGSNCEIVSIILQ